MAATRTTLAGACERALVAGARPRCAGTRQQLRAAARRFVRRHRRDTGYLRWVLRSVAASGALAVALLGLGAEPAYAKATVFTALTGASNPLDGMDAGSFSTPALGDLDGDGDLDVVAGARAGTFRYFENTGEARHPAYVERTGAANPLDEQDVGAFSTPALGDLDADGDLDLVVGEDLGSFSYFENTGSATDPAFVRRTGGQNPLDGQDVCDASAPALADLDGDGDLDLVAGERDGTFLVFENTGSATSPAYVQRTGASTPLIGEDVGYYATPALGDLDGDGDLDLVAGRYTDGFVYFENTGSATSPAFVARSGAVNPLDGEVSGSGTAPALGDLDGDADLDVVAGEDSGRFLSFENLAGRLAVRTGTFNPLLGLGFIDYSAPSLGDLDADGDLDVVAGEKDGRFFYFENTGSATSPHFIKRTGAGNPLDGQDAGYRSTPALGDLDGDGDLDLVAGEGNGTFLYFQNTGSAASPAFALRTGAGNPLDGQDTGYGSTPALGDLDGDGDLDLVAGEQSGALLYFENTGTRSNPAFVPRAFGFTGPAADSAPALGDVDGDGDLDLVVGGSIGTFAYFENSGSATSPAFRQRTGAGNPLYGEDVGVFSKPTLGDLDGDSDLDLASGKYQFFSYFENAIVKPSLTAFELSGGASPLFGQDLGDASAPAIGDLDADGDLDLVSGEFNGSFAYFENTANATSPDFVARTGAANPLDGQNAGYFPRPSLADLDGDGDLDLLAGRVDGSFRYFENIGTATGPAYVSRTGSSDPLDGQNAGGNLSVPAVGDLDGDGDLDLVAGNTFGTFAWFENTGSATTPAFVPRTGAANPLSGKDVGNASAPSLGDFDRDGDLDFVSGDSFGFLQYFENTGSATLPVFIQRTGADNPFQAKDVGARSVPASGDLDGDGDLDLIAGADEGQFAVFYLPEPAQGVLLGAGAALLSLLERLRGRGKRRAAARAARRSRAKVGAGER